jgi:hypothetical protein
VLASLLPGLRDVRVPLTVGYLWLFNVWLWFGGYIPRKAPDVPGVIRRSFELGELLGQGAVVAALSFTAYLLGLLLQLPAFGSLPRWVVRVFWVESSDSRGTRDEYQTHLAKLNDRIFDKSNGLSPHDFEQVDTDAAKATSATVDELRPRLLVANQELFGEYDRLAAEAQFRLNVCPPLLALGVTAAVTVSAWIALFAVIVSYALLTQAFRKRAQSVSVIQRAVLAGQISHPLQAILDRFGPRTLAAHQP